MFSGSQDAKERIRQVVDIVDLVGEQIELRRQGRLFVGLCPWHADSKPSLQVNPDRQSWKCWVCDLGGDIFSFVMQREGVGFREAVRMLADRAGVTLTPGPSSKSAPAGSPDDKQTLYRAMAWACQQFHQCLREDAEGELGRDYLQRRRIDAESIERFQLGFVPNSWTWLLDRAQRESFSPEVLNAIGLILRSERTNGWFDRFRGRVMFPICDPQRRPIAVGGRILPELADDKSAKYINSPETRLFSKSEQLYGLHLARDFVSREREVIVMEGYTDVVIARQHGIEQAVAVLGTALGPRHIQLLRRFADRITLLLDGDSAGQRRASEILELFIANQVDLRIVTLPENLDPCDFLLQHGKDALLNLVANAPDAWEYKIQLETRGLDPLRDTHRANQALENLVAALSKAPRHSHGDSSAQRLREQQVLNRLAREFRLDEGQLRQRLTAARRDRPTGFASPLPGARLARGNESLRLEPMERDLFELLIQYPEFVPPALEQIHVTQLKSPTARQLYQHFAQVMEEGATPNFATILLRIDEPALKSLLVELDEAGQQKSVDDCQTVLTELLQTFSRRQTEEQLQRQQAALESPDLNEQQQLEMLLDIFRTRKELIDN